MGRKSRQHADFPLNVETGMLKFTPVDRNTGERLAIEIVYRVFPRDLEYHGVIVDPVTSDRYRVTGKECDMPGCSCDAWVERIDDARMPDFFPSPEHDVWSVQIGLPADVEDLIVEQEDLDEGEVWTTIIHGALWRTRAHTMNEVERRMDLVSELYPAMQDVEHGRTVSLEETRATLSDRLKARMQLLDSIERGNLLLPEKLYVFVLEQVDAGCFPTATDFVAACLRSPDAAARQTVAGRFRSRLAQMSD